MADEMNVAAGAAKKGIQSPALKEMFGKLKGGKFTKYLKANPGMSTGLGIGGAANLAGLFDNDKVGGQLLGAGAGGGLAAALPALLGTAKFTPQGIAMAALTGGGLGALFDAVRAKKDAQTQYGGYPQMQQTYPQYTVG